MNPVLTAIIIILACLAALFVLWIISIRPRSRRPRSSYFLSYNYAHRGLHKIGVPENSLAAFELACAAGYGIELDVQLSSDGVPMVFHDGTLKRMCEGKSGGIIDYTCEELKTFRLASTDQTIPTFREVLDLVGGRVPLIVEIKNDGDGIHTAEVAAKVLDSYSGDYCIESFNPFIVNWYRKNRPDVIRGQLSQRFFAQKKHRTLKFFVLETMVLNLLARPDFIAYNFKHRKCLPFLVAQKLWRAPTFAWTPRNDDEAAMCRSFGSIIFENIKADVRNEA